MVKRFIYPQNKEHFRKHILLAKKVISICQKNKILLTIYGSFPHFYHTCDEKMNVNDLDILVKEKDFSKLIKALKKDNIQFRTYPPGIIVGQGKLRIELDRMEKKYNSANNSFFKNTDKIDFYGVKVNILSLKQLEEIYLDVDIKTKKDKIKMGKKVRHLERFLGRKLK